MIHVVYGKEYFLIKEYIDNIKNNNKDNETIVFDYEESDMLDIFECMMSISLFDSNKTIIVNNFNFKDLNDKDTNLLNKIIDSSNNNILIFRCDNVDERKTIIKKIKEKHIIKCFNKLDRISLNNYITNIFKINGFKITNDIVKNIINKCGYSNYIEDNGYIFNEVNKLIIYKGKDKSVTLEDLKIINKNIETSLYTFVGYVLSKNKDNMFKEFKIIKDNNIDPYIIVSTLAKQYRLLLSIKSLNTYNISFIASTLEVNPYIIEVNMSNSNLYSIEELASILEKLYDIDFKMKSSTVNYYSLIEKFLLDICYL